MTQNVTSSSASMQVRELWLTRDSVGVVEVWTAEARTIWPANEKGTLDKGRHMTVRRDDEEKKRSTRLTCLPSSVNSENSLHNTSHPAVRFTSYSTVRNSLNAVSDSTSSPEEVAVGLYGVEVPVGFSGTPG